MPVSADPRPRAARAHRPRPALTDLADALKGRTSSPRYGDIVRSSGAHSWCKRREEASCCKQNCKDDLKSLDQDAV